MASLTEALGPAFAAGFAIQRLLEILDPIIGKRSDKKALLGAVALVIGIGLSWFASVRVLEPLGVTGKAAADIFVTGLVISGGTEGFNSIVKFLGYKKDEKKAAANASDPAVATG